MTGLWDTSKSNCHPAPSTHLPLSWLFCQVLTLVVPGPVGDTENREVLFWGFCEEKVGMGMDQ